MIFSSTKYCLLFCFDQSGCSIQAHLAADNSIFWKLIKFVLFGTSHAKFAEGYCGKVTSKHIAVRYPSLLVRLQSKLFY